MNQTRMRSATPSKFGPTFEEVCKDAVDEKINQVFRAEARNNPRDLYLSSGNFEEIEKINLSTY
jgi:hypothetical protein